MQAAALGAFVILSSRSRDKLEVQACLMAEIWSCFSTLSHLFVPFLFFQSAFVICQAQCMYSRCWTRGRCLQSLRHNMDSNLQGSAVTMRSNCNVNRDVVQTYTVYWKVYTIYFAIEYGLDISDKSNCSCAWVGSTCREDYDTGIRSGNICEICYNVKLEV